MRYKRDLSAVPGAEVVTAQYNYVMTGPAAAAQSSLSAAAGVKAGILLHALHTAAARLSVKHSHCRVGQT